jgi:hypothetical protein
LAGSRQDLPIILPALSIAKQADYPDTSALQEGLHMRIVPFLLATAAAMMLSACAVVGTAASVTGTVVSTAAGVAGDAVRGVSRTVTDGGDDSDKPKAEAPDAGR